MITKIVECSKCGESDYRDYMAMIDNKLYCQSCWEEEMETMENEVIKEVTQ